MQSFMSGRSQRMMKMGGLTCPPESGGQHGQSPCERGFRSRIPTRFALEPPDARPRRSRAPPLTQGGTVRSDPCRSILTRLFSKGDSSNFKFLQSFPYRDFFIS
jgi:hypothetical protein